MQEPECTAVLVGSLQDQAALYGILMKIRSPGLTLLSLDIGKAGQNDD